MSSRVRVELQRFGYTPLGTLGAWRVFLEGRHDVPELEVYSAENPDRGNQPNVSCVPEGEYLLKRSTFHRGGYPCFQLFSPGGSEIPGRTLVKVHRGNVADDVQGCVVLGNGPMVSRRNPQWGVGPSGGASGGFTRFMALMDRLGVDECPLTIFHRKG